MGAAALTARIPRIPSSRVARAHEAACGLAFHRTGGPLVAICGLTGGAGTTTVAHLLARQAATESTVPVLLTETTENRAGLATVTGRATPHPLSVLAKHIADDVSPTDTFVQVQPRLRLVAAPPRNGADPDPDLLSALLAHAREAHGLVVVDCGATWQAGSPALADATAIAWTVPATPSGLRSAQAMLESSVLPAAGSRSEALVVTAIGADMAPVRAFRRLARKRCERLILIPRLARSALEGHVVDEQIAYALTGLAPLLRSVR